MSENHRDAKPATTASDQLKLKSERGSTSAKCTSDTCKKVLVLGVFCTEPYSDPKANRMVSQQTPQNIGGRFYLGDPCVWTPVRVVSLVLCSEARCFVCFWCKCLGPKSHQQPSTSIVTSLKHSSPNPSVPPLAPSFGIPPPHSPDRTPFSMLPNLPPAAQKTPCCPARWH